MVVGSRIKLIRDLNGLTQKELADKVKINYSVLSRIESGERPARDEEIKCISKVLNVSSDYLLGLTDIREPADKISTALEGDSELFPFWRELKEREELQLLFKQTKTLDKSTIQQIIRIIKAIEDEEARE